MKNKLILLEFNGIPGSGKTTLSNRMIANMKDMNYTIESYHRVIKKPTRKNLRHLTRYLFSIKPSSFKLGYFVVMYLFTNKIFNQENWRRVISLIILFDLYQKKSLENNDEVIVVDQGIIQQMISMLYKSELIDDKYVKKIIKYTKKKDLGVCIINVDTDVKESFDRLSQRKGNISRIQTLSNEMAINTLNTQQNNLCKIRKIINEIDLESIDINTKESIDKNVLLLENYIMKTKNEGIIDLNRIGSWGAMKNEIMVSVSCITFNHENYIAEAIESFVRQKTSFNYEILIHDDASIDKTAEIIRKYEKEYPELIKVIYQKENLYSKDVDVDDLNTERAKGKYIALCEGDDYWIDPYKLQKQVDYMEAHSECTLCVHAAYIVNVMGKKIKPIRANVGNKIFSVEEVIEGGGGLFATNSMMYPRYLDLNKPDFYKKAPVTDYPLVIYLALKGKVYYIDEYMAAYRKGVSGSWTNTEQSSLEKIIKHVKNTEIMLDQLNQYTGYQFNKAIENKKNKNLFKILIAQERYKELRKGKFKSVYKNITTKEKTKLVIKQYFPRSVKIYKGIRRKYKLK